MPVPHSPAGAGGGAPNRARTRRDTDRRRQIADIGARTVAASVGGYAVTALTTALLARLLPWSKIEAAIATGTFSFVLYVTIACWAFAARSAWRFGAVLTGICAVFAAIFWWPFDGALRP